MRFKSVLGAFTFLVLASFVAMTIFIQTDTFGRVASKVITDLGHRKAKIKISFKSVHLNVFPPGIELVDVKIRKKIDEDKKINLEFGKLGFYIGLFEVNDWKLSLGEIRLSDSVIDYYAPENKDEEIKEIDQGMINKIFDEFTNLPLRVDAILLENTKVFVNFEMLEAKRLKISKRGDDFLLRFHLANLKPVQDQEFTIDEIWGDARIGRKDISIHRLKIQHDVHTLLVKGKVKNYPKLKEAEATFAGESVLHLGNLKNEILLPELIKMDSGDSHLSFRGEYKSGDVNGLVDLSVVNLRSSVVHADQVLATVQFKEKSVQLQALSLAHKEERLKLNGPAELFNFKTKKILPEPLSVTVIKLELENALRILPSLKILTGQLSGALTFGLNQKNLEFKLQDNFSIQKLALVVGDNSPFTILKVDAGKLRSSTFKLVNGEFQMDSQIELKNSKLDVHGFVNAKQVDFQVINADVDFEDFGNIAQIDVKGRGKLDLSVTGPLDDTHINIKGHTNNFEVLGYKLGKSIEDLTIDFKDSTVIINRLDSLYRNTPISGTGSINYGNLDIALGITSSKANFHDLKEILHPIFKNLSFLPHDLDLNAKIDANIFGKTTLDQLRIKSEVQYNDLVAFGENISSGEFNVGLKDNLLTINEFVANKNKGQIRGDFAINLKNDQLKFSYDWDDLTLSSFKFAKKLQLNFNGLLSGSLLGDGTVKNYHLKLDSKMTDTVSREYVFEDSLFHLNISPQFIAGDLNLFGQTVTSNFKYAQDGKSTSVVKLNINAPSLKPLATAFLGQHLEAENFTGELKFSLDSDFKSNWQDMNLKAYLESFIFKHENFSFNYSSASPQFLIENDHVKRWELVIQQPDLYVKTKGTGTFGDQVSLLHEIHFSSKLFEVLLSSVLSSDGYIRNIVKIDGAKDKYSLSGTSRGSDLNMTLDFIPFPLNHLNYVVDFTNNKIIIHELKTSLENGSAGVKGDIFFDDQNPDINLKYFLDKAELPIMGKSFANLSGEGIILGNSPPYSIGGDIIINKAQILNEITDFSSKSSSLAGVRFLPQTQDSTLGKLVNLNVNVKTDSPIRIANSLLDISLRGEVSLTGTPTRPRGEGSLKSVPNSSRVFFKNNEYTITNADINFSPKKDISNPSFDVQALTLISSYKVNAKAYGDLERFNFDLTSEPALPRNSILSLIAFGYSDEIQGSLTQQQQQNLTQVGVGSFVFDRFKISDILNKQFGLQVNLGTVFEQSQTASLLTGRNQDGQGTLGRTRTATKIELKKRLDEALNLSVSSTMGGSIGQRQSMNLNYTVSKKVQLEGIYELRTNAEGEEDIIDNSIGGDVKFRWTFK